MARWRDTHGAAPPPTAHARRVPFFSYLAHVNDRRVNYRVSSRLQVLEKQHRVHSYSLYTASESERSSENRRNFGRLLFEKNNHFLPHLLLHRESLLARRVRGRPVEKRIRQHVNPSDREASRDAGEISHGFSEQTET